MNRRFLATASATLLAIVALAGCSSATGISAFDRPQTEGDELPQGFEHLDEIDAHSVRFLVESEGIRYYTALAEDSAVGCVLMVPATDSDRFAAGCGPLGGSDVVVTASNGPGTREVTLVTDDANVATLENTSWTRIHPNIYTRHTSWERG